MNSPHIATATVFPRLRHILTSDINKINELIALINSEGNLQDFLRSLVDAKKSIIADLPADTQSNYNGSPNVPQKGHMSGYNITDIVEKEDRVKILNTVLDTEISQFELVKSAVGVEGLPEDLEENINSIADKYALLVDHIERSMKTQQFGTIVL